MDNSDIFSLIGLGMVIGVALSASTRLIPNSVLYTYYEVIKQCEAELPRDQHCVITAIPEVNDGQR